MRKGENSHMKRKSKKSLIKRKKEFRFHSVELPNKIGIKRRIRHPAFVFLEKGNIFVYVTITHSNNVKDVVVIKLRKNPNPKDSRNSYRVIEIREDTKDRFGRREKGWKIDPEDEKDIRDEYKKQND